MNGRRQDYKIPYLQPVGGYIKLKIKVLANRNGSSLL